MSGNARRYGLSLGVAVLLILSGLLWQVGSSQGNPGARLTLDCLEYNLGTFSHDGKKAVTVHFKNSGTEPLHIREIGTGPNCTASMTDQDTWMPGEAGKFDVTYHAAGFPGSVIKRSIYVHSNDSSSPVTAVTLLGRMETLLAVVPDRIDFGRCAPRAGLSRRVVVTHLGAPESDLAIDFADVNFPEAVVLVRPAQAGDGVPAQVLSAQKAYAIILSLLTPDAAGTFHGEMTIGVTIDGSDRRAILVPVAGEVRPSIAVDPPRLLFDLRAGPISSETLSLRSPTVIEVTVESSGAIACVPRTTEAARQWLFDCLVRRDDVSGGIEEGHIRFHRSGQTSDDPISVPYIVLR